MTHTSQPYEDWKDFFTKKLVNTGLFILSSSSSKGDTDIEIYSALKDDLNTIIKVGYFSPMTLIYMHFLNPETPGKNRQQEIEHLYKYEFDEEKQYGQPGLDFNEMNIQGISNYLEQGFNGSEIVYYKKGKPVKSRLTTSYYPDSPKNTITYHFAEEPIYKRLHKKIIGIKDQYDQVKVIDLNKVFKGFNGS